MKIPGFTARTKARKRAVDVLFEADQRGPELFEEDLLELLEERREISAAQTPLPAYAQEIVVGVAEHLGEIDDLISTFARGWSIERMPGVDRAVARAAIWEIKFNPEVDDVVAIDEAVTMVKVLSTDDSPKFINALLDRIREHIAAVGAALGE